MRGGADQTCCAKGGLAVSYSYNSIDGDVMLRLPSHEVQRQWGRVQDMALVEPVTVTSKGRDRLVMMSSDEYARLKRRDRQVMLPSDFSDEDISQLESSRAPLEAAAFDHELHG